MSILKFSYGRILSILLLLFWAVAGSAATIEKRILDIRPGSDGSVLEKTTLAVVLDTAPDLEEWAKYPIFLDTNRELVTVDARVRHPDQSIDKVRSRDQETVEGVGSSTHSSLKVRLLEFRGLRLGSRLEISYTVRERPYFSGGRVGILNDDPTAYLRVEVRWPNGDLRYRLEGVDSSLQVREEAWGIVLEARDLPAYEESTGPSSGEYSERGSLNYSWGSYQAWSDLGTWYQEILDSVPVTSPEVSALAHRLTGGKADREALVALIDYVQSDIRYVAVEVGIGGYRPSSPKAVYQRRWGDCKDKALLFIQLLDAVGIEAFPVLIRLGSDRRIDEEFPSPWGFNHMITAVKMGGIESLDSDPTTEDLLFVDATQTRGQLAYLNPWIQGRTALVVGDGMDRLVTLPVLEKHERTLVTLNLEENQGGDARAELSYESTGSAASALIDEIESEEGQRKALGYRVIDRVLPGSTADELRWDYQEEGLPTARLRANVAVPSPRSGLKSLGFRPPNFRILPEPNELVERTSSVALLPEILEVRWEAPLPTGCRPAEGQDRFVEKLGTSFRQTISVPADGRIRIVRVTTIKRRFFEEEELGGLREVALEEYRAQKKRIRLTCET